MMGHVGSHMTQKLAVARLRVQSCLELHWSCSLPRATSNDHEAFTTHDSESTDQSLPYAFEQITEKPT